MHKHMLLSKVTYNRETKAVRQRPNNVHKAFIEIDCKRLLINPKTLHDRPHLLYVSVMPSQRTERYEK